MRQISKPHTWRYICLVFFSDNFWNEVLPSTVSHDEKSRDVCLQGLWFGGGESQVCRCLLGGKWMDFWSFRVQIRSWYVVFGCIWKAKPYWKGGTCFICGTLYLVRVVAWDEWTCESLRKYTHTVIDMCLFTLQSLFLSFPKCGKKTKRCFITLTWDAHVDVFY